MVKCSSEVTIFRKSVDAGDKKKKNVIKKTILSSHWLTDTSSDIVVIFTCASVYCSLFKASNNYKPIYIYINIYIIYKYTFSESV